MLQLISWPMEQFAQMGCNLVWNPRGLWDVLTVLVWTESETTDPDLKNSTDASPKHTSLNDDHWRVLLIFILFIIKEAPHLSIMPLVLLLISGFFFTRSITFCCHGNHYFNSWSPFNTNIEQDSVHYAPVWHWCLCGSQRAHGSGHTVWWPRRTPPSQLKISLPL